MAKKPPKGLVQKEDIFADLNRRLTFFLKTFNRLYFLQIALFFVIIGIYSLLVPTALFNRFENVILDGFFKLRPALTVDSSIAFIEIAEDSIEALGRWPWPRRYHAAMTHLLSKWGAKAIVFDIVFSEPSDALDDDALELAIQEAKNVYFPVILEPQGEESKWIRCLKKFEKHAKGVGHINVTPDPDGVIRRIRPFLSYGDEAQPYLGARLGFDMLDEKIEATTVPKDEAGNWLVNWGGNWEETFEHFSFVDLLKSFEAVEHGKEPLIAPERLRNKICIIGLTATGLSDIKSSPLDAAYPAVGVLANVMNSIIRKSFVWPAPVVLNQLCLWGIGILALFFFVPFRNVLSVTAGILMLLAIPLLAFVLFWKIGIWFFVFQPLLLVLTLLIFSAVFAQIIANQERQRLLQLATRDGLTGLFVIRHFRMLFEVIFTEANQLKQPLAVILIDIDNFKKINDTYGHQAGDMVLKGVAQKMVIATRSLRETGKEDILGRYGGEEMIVLLRKTDLTLAAFTVAERIRKAVAESSFQWEGVRISVTISLGVSALLEEEDSCEKMIARADAALYRAKHEGKNRVCVQETAAKDQNEKVS